MGATRSLPSDRKYTAVPSGRHTGSDPLDTDSLRAAVEPFAERTYTCGGPDSGETYAIQRPSGEKRGALSSAAVFANGVRSPFLRISQTSRPVVGFCSMNASTSPSADHEPGSCNESAFVSRSAGPSALAGAVNRFKAPLRLDANVTRCPSGNQIGDRFVASNVSCVSVPVFKSYDQTCSASSDTSSNTLLPSGETRAGT